MERAAEEKAVVYWCDETRVSSRETVERGFAPKGHPAVLPAETKRERVNMISAISSQGGVRFMVYQQSMDQRRLIPFMQHLISTAAQKVFLILDNLKEKIEVFFLPPYAPEYNPDEYLNHALKLSVHTGQLPYTTDDISHKIYSFMRTLQHHPFQVTRFFFHPRLSYLLERK